MKRIATLTALTAIAALTAGTASANFIQNSGFEDGSGTDAAVWEEIVGGPNGTVGRSNLMPDVGTYSGLITFDNSSAAAGGAYFIQQTSAANTIDSTENHNLSFRAKVSSTNFFDHNVFYQIQWLDQDGSDGGGVRGESLIGLVGEGINTSYQTFGLSDIDVPDSADSFLLRFQIAAGASDGGVSNALYVDQVSLTEVPEPSSLALLGLGGLAMMRRRRNV